MPPHTKSFLPRRTLIGLLLLCIPVATLLFSGFLLKRELLPIFSYTLQNTERITLNRAVLKRSLANAERWLWNDFNTRGYFGKEYDPRTGRYTPENDITHQIAASLFLTKNAGDNPILTAFHKKNLEYIFSRSYREEAGRGSIVFDGTPSLGGSGLALSVIARSSFFEEYHERGAALAAALVAQQQKSGAFGDFSVENRTPSDPQGGPNLGYVETGQAIAGLLAWHEKTGDEQARSAALKAREFYAQTMLRESVSFNPVQILAFAGAYERSRDTAYRDAIFAWSDRLVGTQQLSGDDPKLIGLFADSENQRTLTTSANTATSIQALTQAYLLALDEGDAARQERYKTAIFLGAYNLLNLQYGAVSALAFPYPRSMVGGIRNAADDPRIRVNAVRETIEALQLVLERL